MRNGTLYYYLSSCTYIWRQAGYKWITNIWRPIVNVLFLIRLIIFSFQASTGVKGASTNAVKATVLLVRNYQQICVPISFDSPLLVATLRSDILITSVPGTEICQHHFLRAPYTVS